MFEGILQESAQTTRRTERFGGLNRREDCGAGEYIEGENLSSRRYPLLCPAKKRRVLGTLSNPTGILGKESLAWVDGGVLYYGGAAVAGLSLDARPKTMVSMGAYIVIFPDKVYVNTADLTDFGSLEHSFQAQEAVLSLCFRDGSALEPGYIGENAPEEANDGEYWLDTGNGGFVLRRFSVTWMEVSNVYVKIAAPGIGLGFSQCDGVTISGIVGAQAEKLNSSTVLETVGENFVVIAGILPAAVTSPVAISRWVPELDFVTECGNRLWGCRFGLTGGRTVNEIYACALGDFKNWNRFQGLSTDSYVASRGADGCFTGAITYQGSPMFFRAGCIERVYPDASGAHRIAVNNCRGVAPGCGGSLAIVDGLLFYKSPVDICSYDGSLPRCRSAALGEEAFTDVCAGSVGSRYYCAMTDSRGERSLYCYDAGHDIWHREEGEGAAFAACGGELVMLDACGRLLSLTEEGEGEMRWHFETGRIGTGLPARKYLRRVQTEFSLEPGTEVEVAVRYDDEGEYTLLRSLQNGGSRRTVTIPLIPRRCGWLRLRISGQGGFTLHALTELLAEGSEVTWL